MANKTVLITGAARRVGASMARHLHANGMDVIIHYHTSEQPAQALVRELNSERAGSATAIRADLRDSGELPRIITEACGFTGVLDVLINNASAFYPTALAELTTGQWEELMDVNMKAPLFLAQHAAPHLRASRGCIINITDIHADRPLRGHSVYSASKAGLLMLTRALARELGPEVRVNAIAPGAILWQRDLSEAARKTILSRTVLKRQGHPLDIARAAQYLIEDAGYMTGQVLTLDGGRTLFS